MCLAPFVADDAVPDMPGSDRGRSLVERGAHCIELVQNLAAVSAFFHEPFDPADLPLDS